MVCKQPSTPVLSSCNHHVCVPCVDERFRVLNAGAESGKEKRVATCPVCDVHYWGHDDWIYHNDLRKALQPNFLRSRCCWCGAIAHYRCAHHCYDYCSRECLKEHAAKGHVCSPPWHLPDRLHPPSSDRLALSDTCQRWVSVPSEAEGARQGYFELASIHPSSWHPCSAPGCDRQGRRRCGGCRKARRNARYCSKECQKSHWSMHKKECVASM